MTTLIHRPHGHFDTTAGRLRLRAAASGGLRHGAWSLGLAVLGAFALSACAHSPAGMRASEATNTPAATSSATARAFEGAWAYAQSCGWRHSANLELTVTANDRLRGLWADGTRVRGESGSVRATVRGDKAFLRFCRDPDDRGAASVCPEEGPEEGREGDLDSGPETAYLVRNGERLDWFRGSSTHGFRPYLSLHRVVAGQDIPKDDTCPEESDDG